MKLPKGEFERVMAAGDDIVTVTVDSKTEQGETLDFLGVVAWNRDGVRPYIMFGPAAVELEDEVTSSRTGLRL